MSDIGSEATLTSPPADRAPLWAWMRARRYGPADILKAFGMTAPPVRVGTLAQGMDVELIAVLGVTYDAALESSPTRAVVRVNRSHPPVRQRFSIAHELGHLMLHQLGECFRDTAGSMSGDPRERAANRFAAELLVPASMVKPLVPVYGSDIKGLAKLFQVSEAAMGFRLRNLYHL